MDEKVTTRSLQKWKKEGRKIVAVTAYDNPSAKLAEDAGIDVILVGDSVGNTILGYETTVPVTLSEILHHLKAVWRGIERALLVADMPFMSYGVSVEDTIYNAGKLMQAGAEAVKLEGASPITLAAMESMVEIGIPVMAHLGFTPQSVHQFGGFRVQGRSAEAADALMNALNAVENAGAFAVVLELIPADLAERLTQATALPTIGIGAGAGCDGQIQVWHDILGLSEETYKHTKHYVNLREQIGHALQTYAREVKEKQFPTEEQSF